MNKYLSSKLIAFTLIAAIVFVGRVGVAQAVNPNLILNPGVETASSDPANPNTPEHWARGGYGTNDRAYDYLNTNGSMAIKVSIGGYTNGDAKWYFTPVDVSAGGLYRYTDHFTSNAESYLFAEYTAADNTLKYEQIAAMPSTNGAWVSGTQDFTPPAGTTKVSVLHIIKSENSELTMDNFSLTELKSPAENLFAPHGIVSVAFDDGWENQYTAAFPVLTTYNIPASFYVISGTVANHEYGYLTSADILDLQSHGNEIGAHTVHHCNLTLIPSLTACAFPPEGGTTTVADEILNSKLYIDNLGANVTTFAYPNGGYDDTIKSLVQTNGMIAARSIDAGFNTRFSDKFALKTQVVDTTVPMQTIKGWIDSAAANNTWLILTFHQVAPLAELQSNNDEGGVTPQDFQEIMSYIASVRDGGTNPIDVATINNVIPLMSSTSIDPVDPLDTLAPVITLNGASPVTITLGSTYTDAGATASDNVDGDISSSIVVTGSVNTSVPGSYTLTYNVADAAGNHATEVTRSVIVGENSIPVITLTGDATMHVSFGSTYTDAGATASDIEDGDITSHIVTTGTVTTSVPDTYIVSYNVDDSYGAHATTVTRTVVVDQQVSSGGGGGGGSSGGGGGGGYVPPITTTVASILPPVQTTNGQILGAECSALITKNLSYHSSKNDVAEVKKLQAFLNTEMGTKLPTTGFYGTMTLAAVKNFQNKYKADILTPVKLTKPNGNVFTFTRTKINAINCIAK